ncbi:myxosortase-dependent M36 family metallopeptidase [Myxococcaceae bacterium GXIMD 01537]
MKRLWMSTVSAVFAVLMWSPQAQAKGGTVDAFLLAPANRALPESAAGVSQRGLRINSVEGRVGVPTFLFSDRALSAGPTKALRPVTQSSADAAARAHLRGVADLYRMSRSEVDGAELQTVHLPKGNGGAVIAKYGRRVNGIEVFRNELKVVMDASQELVAISGYLQPRQASDEQNAQASAFRVSAPQAISNAFRNLTGNALDARALNPSASKGDYSEYTVDKAASATHGFGTAPRAKKVLFPMPDELVPAYYVEVNVGPASNPDAEYYAYVINARDGSVLFKHNLTASEAFTYRVWADPAGKLPHDGPQGIDATPHPTGTPDGFQAPLGAPANLVTLQSFPFSRNDPWLAPNATQTTGNNVDAYADLGGADGFQAAFDLRAPLSDAASRTFDYQYDVTRSPSSTETQRLASIVNLFYVNNFLHDWYYDAGFDEASGNAQMSNYGRGGLEGDSIRAEAQDFGGRNNANMSTPADGARPRMQQYVFDGVAELAVTAPANIARIYDSYSAAFGPATYDVDKAAALPPTDPDNAARDLALRIGCSDANGTNPYTGTPFAGKIAIIERGSCGFAYKARNAQLAGAVGVIITNSATGALGRMGASGVPAVDNAITIPAVMVSKPDGDAWRTELTNNVATQVRMRKTPDLDRDGTLDNDIVSHEWGHYISNRLVGNAVGLSSHQGRSMGEGWGDFHALLSMVRAEDITKPGNNNWQGVYGMAGYTMSGGRNQGYYWGIRRVPYSTDFTKNALTLKHIANGVALPSHPVAGGANGANNSEVHNAGEVWTSMLWECYASLLNAHPFAEAQDRMKRYLVASYKATPMAPTFLEARDALLSVTAANDPADYQRFLAAFAKRGAGFGAQVADRGSQDHIGVVESYETGNVLQVVSIKVDDSSSSCDKDGILDAGEQGSLVVTVKNVGASDLSGVAATAAFNGSSAGVLAAFVGSNTLSFGNIARGTTATARVNVDLQQAPAPAAGQLATLGLDVTFPNKLPSGGTVEAFRTQVNYDEAPNASAIDNVATAATPWIGPTLGNSPMWKNQYTGAQTYWHGQDPDGEADASLTSPIFKVATSGSFNLYFKTRFSFETDDGFDPYYDGGVLEISVDEGAWTDVFDFDWYTGTTTNAGYVNLIDLFNPYLPDRPGYVGMSAGFPAFQQIRVNFGPQFQGKSVRVRFRIGSDAGVGAYGWDVDDIQVTGVTNLPFNARVAEAFDGSSGAPVCNVRPVAEAGAAQTVQEYTVSGGTYTPTVVTLNGAGSFDPDGTGTLTYAWTQLAGPTVTLSDATVASPTFSASISEDTIFTFQLAVHDGIEPSIAKQVQVLMRNTNRAPTALAGVLNNGPNSVDERSGSVTLDASGSTDPDGEELAFTWEQTEGPEVKLDDPTSATPTFTPPEVTADTRFSFELVADDGIDASEGSTITITVRQVDRAPTADAGPDQQVKARSTVTLAGTASDPDGDALSYAWTQTEGTAVTLTGGDTATPSFTAPNVKQGTERLRFNLVASANGTPSLPNTVDVIVSRDNRKPVAGSNGSITADERSAVTVSGTATDADGDALTYHWTQVGGPTVALNGANTAELSFTAPDVLADTTLVFRLVVSDDLEAGAAHDVAVTVKNVNRAPSAHAEAIGTGKRGNSITLTAAGSSDPDGQALTYKWAQTGGPSVELVSANSAVATFIAPRADVGSEATFEVTVTDADGVATKSQVSVSLGILGQAPSATAAIAGTGKKGNTLTLNGFGSSDPEGAALTYKWVQKSGSAVTLKDADKAVATFVAPDVAAGAASFELTVTDDEGQSATALVNINLGVKGEAPTAKIGLNGTGKEGDTVTMNGVGSTDPDGSALTYKWVQKSGPAVELSSSNGAFVSFTAPEAEEGSVAVFELTVTDDEGQSASSTVSIELGIKGNTGCSVAGNGMSGALVPALTMLGLMLRRRRKA